MGTRDEEGSKKQATARINERHWNTIAADARLHGQSFADWLRDAIYEKADREDIDLDRESP